MDAIPDDIDQKDVAPGTKQEAVEAAQSGVEDFEGKDDTGGEGSKERRDGEEDEASGRTVGDPDSNRDAAELENEATKRSKQAAPTILEHVEEEFRPKSTPLTMNFQGKQLEIKTWYKKDFDQLSRFKQIVEATVKTPPADASHPASTAQEDPAAAEETTVKTPPADVSQSGSTAEEHPVAAGPPTLQEHQSRLKKGKNTLVSFLWLLMIINRVDSGDESWRIQES